MFPPRFEGEVTMPCPGWDDEDREDSGWIDDYEEDDFGEEAEEFGEDDDDGEFLDDEALDDDTGEEEAGDSELDGLIDEGEALIEEGEYLPALELFREAAERFPDSALALYHVGQTALMLFSDGVEGSANWEDDDELSGYHEEAQSNFEAALAVDEEFYPALNGQGALAMVLDNPKVAVESWEQSLAIEEDQEDIRAALEEARQMLRRAKKK
jgi:tetratricopeptide (TPR) repeat protein